MVVEGGQAAKSEGDPGTRAEDDIAKLGKPPMPVKQRLPGVFECKPGAVAPPA